MLLMLINIHI